MRNSQEKIFDYLFKLVIIGDSGVGKSNILSKYLTGQFISNSKNTIGVELGIQTIEIQGKCIQNQIWDTAGQERFRAITSSYYRNTVGAVIVFDLTNIKSFEHVTVWLKQIQVYGSADISVILVGNKSDLVDKREVRSELIQDLVLKYKLAYLQTSALNGQNIQLLFYNLTTDIYHKKKNKIINSPIKSINPAGIQSSKIQNIGQSKLQEKKEKKNKKNCC